MTCNIAFTAPGFTAVAADTRILVKREDGNIVKIDTKDDYENLGFEINYPSPLLKIRNIGLGWATSNGNIFYGNRALSLINEFEAAGQIQAENILQSIDENEYNLTSIKALNIIPDDPGFIFGAPFSCQNLPIWEHSLLNRPVISSKTNNTILAKCSCPPTNNAIQELTRLLYDVRERPTPFIVARTMGEIIKYASEQCDNVSPYIQFGMTQLKNDNDDENDKLVIQAYYSGHVHELLSLHERDFLGKLVALR